MSFAQPWWLLLGLLGLVVLLLHIRRRQVVEVSNVELWRQLASSHRPQRTWRPPRPSLLLLLQLLAVALLVLALARPQLQAQRSVGEHWIVMVDRSGSMLTRGEEGHRFDLALAYVNRELESSGNGVVGRGRPLSLVAVGPRADLVGARVTTIEAARDAIGRLVPAQGGAAWNQAAALLPGLVREGESIRVTVLSDGSGAEAGRVAVAALLPEAELKVVAFGAGEDNVGLAETGATPLDLNDGLWLLKGEVRSFAEAPGPITLEVLFSPGGVGGALSWASEDLRFRDGSAPFELDLELPGVGLLELRLPDDALAADNSRWLWLGTEPRTVRVLHLGPPNPPLERALEAIDDLELFLADALPSNSAEFDLVVVDRVQPQRHPGTHTLWLGGALPDGESASPLGAVQPTGWRGSHPLASSVDWSAVDPGPAFRASRLPGATVLLEAGDAPLVQARTTGAGREVVAAFDLTNSPWTGELGFPVFVANLLHWVAPWRGQVVGQTCTVGEGCPLDPRSLLGGVDLVPATVEGEAIHLPAPFVLAGSDLSPAQAWAPPGFTDLFIPDRAGVYRLDQEGDLLVVNAPVTEESDVSKSAPELAATEQGAAGGGWWLPYRWLLLAALLLLLIEALLAGRGVERFLQRSGLHRDNPLSGRRRRILALRVATLLLTLLAIFSWPLLLPHRQQRLVLVVDDPDVYGSGAQEFIGGFLTSASDASAGARQQAVVQLGSRAQVVTDFGQPLGELPGSAGTEGADVASALDLSAALLSGAEAGRMVVVGGGTQTRGDLAPLLPELAAAGVAVDVLPVGVMPAGEVLVERLALPPRLFQGDSFTLQAFIQSSAVVPAVVQTWREGELREELSLQLFPGRNRVDVALSEEGAGRFLYEVEVIAEGDVFAENNRDGVLAQVEAKATVGIFTPQLAWGGILAEALSLQGIDAEVLEPLRVPWSVDKLLVYDTVVLMNVPAIDLHTRQQEALVRWTREYGGGLLILGGENTFGPGGYYQTPLEEVSPLSSRIPREAPKVALLFILDRSGSMQQRVGGVSRLEIAKRAAVDAVDLLHKESLTGVVVFDELATSIVPLQQVPEREELQQTLRSLQPGGGTSLYPALESAYRQLAPVDSVARHIVVMSDGMSQPGDFDTILDSITGADITVSTVAIGQGSDIKLLQGIAKRGGGAFHATADVEALPSILSQEAMLLTDTPLEVDTFVPQWQDRGPSFLEGLPEAMPPLQGYVRTSSKDQAQLHLVGPDEDPVLASWRYGLGRVVAFASQGAGEWTRGWLELPFYPLLWSQAVRWALPPVAKPGLHLALERAGDEIRVVVEAVDARGEPAQGLQISGEVFGASAEDQLLRLTALAPGRYQARFAVDGPGSYRVRVTSDDEVETFEAVEAEIIVSYPARFAFESQGGERLRAVVHATEGRVLLGDEPLYVGAVPLLWLWRSVWPLWVVLGLVLLMLDLMLRYAPGFFTFSELAGGVLPQGLPRFRGKYEG